MNGVQPIFFSLIAAPGAAAIIFILISILYFILFRRIVVSVLDPLAYSLAFSTFAASAVILCWWVGYISSHYCLHFVLTQSAFLLAVWGGAPAVQGNARLIENRVPCMDQPALTTRVFFGFCLATNVIMQLSQYYQFGLPIFLESRLAIDAGESGTNTLSRLIVPTSYIVQILSIILIFRCKGIWKIAGYIGAGFIAFTLVVNGSKSGIISFALMMSLVAFYLQCNSLMSDGRFQLYVLLLGALGALFTLAIIRFKYSDSYGEAFLYFLYRLLITGDGYIMGYVGGVIERLPDYNWFIAVFKGPIKALGLVDLREIPPPIGFELFRHYNPWNDALLGPNSRHNLIGLRYIGFMGSIPLSVFFGVLVAATRIPLRYVRGMPPLVFALVAVGVSLSSGIETDFYLFWGKLMNIVLVLPALYVISWVVSHVARRTY